MPFAELFLRPCLLLFTSRLPIMGGWALHGARSGEAACAAPYSLPNWCWCSVVTLKGGWGGREKRKEKKRKQRRYSMWGIWMGPSWTWQMAELFIANSYPVKWDFFFYEIFFGKQIVVSLHSIFVCWCKHVWTKNRLCSLLYSYWFSFIFPLRWND